MATISGGEKLEAYLRDLAAKVAKGKMLKVGFLEGSTDRNGTSIPMVAAVQNFGAPSRGIPPRPFFSNMIAQKSDEWGPALGALLVENDFDSDKALRALGGGMQAQLQQSIRDTNSPPNSPVTNLLKQRFPQGGQTFEDVLKARADVKAGVTAPAGKPLVQSGDMLNAVDYEVKP